MKNPKIISIIFFIFISFESDAISPEERKKLFQASIQKLKDSGIEKRVPAVGEIFQDIVLEDKKISEWTADGPLLLVVYRGGWCPYCVKQLKEIQARNDLLLAKKVTVIAISPETSNEVKKTASKHGLSLKLISDKNGDQLRKLGLIFRVEDKVASEYKSIGINLPISQGNQNQELPIPATYLIGKNRKIEFAFVDADYTTRPSIDVILNLIKNEKIY